MYVQQRSSVDLENTKERTRNFVRNLVLWAAEIKKHLELQKNLFSVDKKLLSLLFLEF